MEEIMEFGTAVFEDGLIVFLIRAAIIFAVCGVLVRIVRGGVNRETQKRGPNTNTQISFIGNLLVTVIRCVAIFLVLEEIKPLSGIGKAALGATSVITIIVGLAAQEAFGNFIAGFFLAMHQPVRNGDLIVIKSQDVVGTVEEITLRHTVIKTFDGTRIIVPNSRMNSEVIENRRADNDLISRLIQVSVSYDTDIDLARRVIVESVSGMKEFVDPRTPEQKERGEDPVRVVVHEFQDSGILLSFRIFNRTSADSYLFAGSVRETILKEFRRHHITIPYPTRTVEIHRPKDQEQEKGDLRSPGSKQ